MSLVLIMMFNLLFTSGTLIRTQNSFLFWFYPEKFWLWISLTPTFTLSGTHFRSVVVFDTSLPLTSHTPGSSIVPQVYPRSPFTPFTHCSCLLQATVHPNILLLVFSPFLMQHQNNPFQSTFMVFFCLKPSNNFPFSHNKVQEKMSKNSWSTPPSCTFSTSNVHLFQTQWLCVHSYISIFFLSTSL